MNSSLSKKPGRLGLWDRLRHRFRHLRWQPDRASGRLAEDIAHRYLEGLGYIVVARNYLARGGDGELDLVARDGDTLVVVEVKSRSTGDFGPPELAVTSEKRRKVIRTAFEFARRSHVPDTALRFDIVSVIHGMPPEVTHFRDAFGYHSSASYNR